MSERTSEPTEEQQPEESQKDKFFRLFNEWMENELGRRSVGAALGPVPAPTAIPAMAADYEDLPKETKQAIDKFMETLKPDIEKKAAELLEAEIRDKIAKTGDINKITAAMKKGKKISLKRKRGCIYLQLGSGDPNDKIEEFLIANTGV